MGLFGGGGGGFFGSVTSAVINPAASIGNSAISQGASALGLGPGAAPKPPPPPNFGPLADALSKYSDSLKGQDPGRAPTRLSFKRSNTSRGTLLSGARGNEDGNVSKPTLIGGVKDESSTSSTTLIGGSSK